ncbi:hypothetical protein ETD83_37985 [Actinomadura soli]|uniref:Uncharacterized protein n=1 Tax=Actinomadura soli TaxID=2508997 RepID=A0A5C4J0L0_9ACTN|nr:hypothetical protein [Actinomadura soli]TMQ89861.1 hypothetical protein ETD83_37985 [Actinomadura soli]
MTAGWADLGECVRSYSTHVFTGTRARRSLSHQPLGKLALAGADDDPYPLPGLPALFSAIAADDLRPDTLLHETASRIVKITGVDISMKRDRARSLR